MIRYGSGKTKLMQRLGNNHHTERVLFITYSQTFVRGLMRHSGKSDFKRCLDAYDDPHAWDAQRLITQLDGLMIVLLSTMQS